MTGGAVTEETEGRARRRKHASTEGRNAWSKIPNVRRLNLPNVERDEELVELPVGGRRLMAHENLEDCFFLKA